MNDFGRVFDKRKPLAGAVGATSEFYRVANLPPRYYASEEDIEKVSAYFRRRDYNERGRRNMLKQLQVETLVTLYQLGGCFANLRVGAGKTLTTLLAPLMVGALRPVLICPAALRDNVTYQCGVHAHDWKIIRPIVYSYEQIGSPSGLTTLFETRPDLVMLDEGHKARNLRAAVTRRVAAYLKQVRPKTLILSGTLITSDLMDYWHLLIWALGDKAPVPLSREEGEVWATALEGGDAPKKQQTELGVLNSFPEGYYAHMRTRSGVITSSGSDCNATIVESYFDLKVNQQTQAHIAEVAATKLRPDGEPLDDPQVPMCLQQLALGFYYIWDPLPPDWWRYPRKTWFAYVRELIDMDIPGLDSICMVERFLDRGVDVKELGTDIGRVLLSEWRKVKNLFKPNHVPIWTDKDATRKLLAIPESSKSIIWSGFRYHGQELARVSGLPYYGGGSDIRQAKPGEPLIASLRAHGTGAHLAAWEESVVSMTSPGNTFWEQLIGRLHRTGQEHDTVIFKIIQSIPYHGESMMRARNEAADVAEAQKAEQKLLLTTKAK